MEGREKMHNAIRKCHFLYYDPSLGLHSLFDFFCAFGGATLTVRTDILIFAGLKPLSPSRPSNWSIVCSMYRQKCISDEHVSFGYVAGTIELILKTQADIVVMTSRTYASIVHFPLHDFAAAYRKKCSHGLTLETERSDHNHAPQVRRSILCHTC